jgi:hypothetical protein
VLTYLLETFTAPLAAARRPVGPGFAPARAAAAVALGTAGSLLAGWIVAGRGAPALGVALVQLAGRLMLDLAVWLTAAALLGAAESAELRRRGHAATAAPSWASPVGVASAQRAYLAPAAALARLARAAYAWRILGMAVWIWAAAVLWLAAEERGHSRPATARLLLVGLGLPALLLAAGAALAGLGWVLRPLLPGGITPFVPL